MQRQDYIDTMDTIFPDGHARESLFRSSGDMLSPAAVETRWWRRIWDGLRYWHIRRSGRLSLRDLTPDQLKDIGVSHEAAQAEAMRETSIIEAMRDGSRWFSSPRRRRPSA